MSTTHPGSHLTEGEDYASKPKTINQVKELANSYIKYTDPSNAVRHHYNKENNSTNLEKYYVHIEDWLKQPITPDQNFPLLIEAEEGFGKKTLLVNWMNFHNKSKSEHQKDIIIDHFASWGGNNCNCFYAMYSILIKLREHFNINQKVELLEEKLRKYFSYWLDLCSRKIKENVVYQGNIIIVIEGLEFFFDGETGQESALKFWLPKTYPDRVRVIVSCSDKTGAAKYLKSIGCNSILISAGREIVEHSIKERLSKSNNLLFSHDFLLKVKEVVDAETETQGPINVLYFKSFISLLCPKKWEFGPNESESEERELWAKIEQKLDWRIVGGLEEEKQLIIYMIGFYADKIAPREQLIDLLAVICLSSKGLSISELHQIVKLSPQEMNRILNLFGEFLLSYEGFYICKNPLLRKIFESTYYSSPEKKNSYHKRIASAIEKSPICIRRLEEQTYHYFCSNENFMLKQIIATVENFLMLFKPATKFDLFRYWQLLEQCGYDPVTEYNKGIELFDSHYNPEADKLFVIILQVCRFLKEFSDFETEITPNFRHPMIRGKTGVIRKKKEGEEETKRNSSVPKLTQQNTTESIPVTKNPKVKLREQINKQRTAKEKTGALPTASKTHRPKEDPLGLNKPFYNANNELSEVDERLDDGNAGKTETFNYLDVIGLLKELKRFKLTTDAAASGLSETTHFAQDTAGLRYEQKIQIKSQFNEVLEHWEEVNVEVPEGKQRFRNFFIELLKKKYSHKNKLKQQEEEVKFAALEQENSVSHSPLSQDDAFNEKQEELKHDYQSKMDDIDLEIKPEKQPSFYYYKRWIWIIFPWACLSIKPELNFSEVIARCYSSATKYMRIDEENEFYSNALEIAVEYKVKKKAIYAKKEDGSDADGGATQRYEEEKQEVERKAKLEALQKKYEKSVGQDCMKTFTNLVVKKEDYEKDLAKLLPAKTQTLLPNLSRVSHTRSQATIKPNLKGLDPRKKLFLTNVDGSVISVENTKFEKISSLAYTKSSLETRIQEKKVQKDQVDSVLKKIDPRNNKALEQLDQTLGQNIHAEIKTLAKDNEQLMKELNDLSFANKHKIKLIERIPKDPFDGGYKGQNPELKLNDDYSRLCADNQLMKNKLEELGVIKERMSHIIEICEINHHQNERWISGLNNLVANYERMIEMENETLKETQQALLDIESVKSELRNEFYSMKKNTSEYADYIESNMHSLKVITGQIKNTDYLIQGKLLHEQKRYEQVAANERSSMYLREKQVSDQKKKKELEAKLSEYRALYIKLKDDFETDNFDAESLEENPKFKELLDNLDTMKKLTQMNIEKEMSKEELELEINRLDREYQTLVLAYSQKNIKAEDEKQDGDDDDDTQTASGNKSIKEEIDLLVEKVEKKKVRVSRLKQFMSDLKTGIMSVSAKSKVEDVDSINFNKKSLQVLDSIGTSLRIARAQLTREQFDMLMAGRLNVEGFLRFTETKKSLSSMKRGGELLTQRTEDSGVGY